MKFSGAGTKENPFDDLEDELSAKLDRSRVACGTDLAKRRCGHIRAGDSAEVDIIEDVERLGAQLQLRVLSEANVFQHRKINTESSRTIDDTAA